MCIRDSLSWLLLTCLLSLYWQGIAPLLRRGFVVLLAVVLLSLGQGKQVVAARHALADMTGMSWLDTAEARQLKARSLRLQDALRAPVSYTHLSRRCRGCPSPTCIPPGP